MTETEVRQASIRTTFANCHRPWTGRINGRMVLRSALVVLLVFLIVRAYQRQKAINALDASGFVMARMVPGAHWLGNAGREPWTETVEQSGWLPGNYIVCRVGPPPRIVTQDALEALVHLQHAERLWLDRCGLTDEHLEMIAQVEAIKILNIAGNPITDKGLLHLTALPSLEFLNVIDTNVTPAGVERFRQVMPQCEVFAKKKPTSEPGSTEGSLRVSAGPAS